MSHNHLWIPSLEEEPTKPGTLTWRIRHNTLPGLVLTFDASMLYSGSDLPKAHIPSYVPKWVSPFFDMENHGDNTPEYEWDYNSWRRRPITTIENVQMDGITPITCPYCRKTPTLHYTKGKQLLQPQESLGWYYKCCQWGDTPVLTDPRLLDKTRLTALTAFCAILDRANPSPPKTKGASK